MVDRTLSLQDNTSPKRATRLPCPRHAATRYVESRATRGVHVKWARAARTALATLPDVTRQFTRQGKVHEARFLANEGCLILRKRPRGKIRKGSVTVTHTIGCRESKFHDSMIRNKYGPVIRRDNRINRNSSYVANHRSVISPDRRTTEFRQLAGTCKRKTTSPPILSKNLLVSSHRFFNPPPRRSPNQISLRSTKSN